MQIGNKPTVVVLALLLFVPAVASGADIKEMIINAIVNGSSSDYLDDHMTKIITMQTKNNAPVQINIKRIHQYSSKCAELEVTAIQGDAIDVAKKKGNFNITFTLPICVDGSYPEAHKQLEDERKKSDMDKCRQTVQKGKMKDGFMEGSIDFNNCSKNGAVRIFYDGTCKEMHPGPDAVVKEFKVDEKGGVSIKMLIPQSCLNSKSSPVAINKWQVFLYERKLPPPFPNGLIGNRPVFW
jgi:hypothetical protein